jgi:hypothetical protein
MGIGYDAVRGSSFGVGRAVVKFNYSEGNAKVWNDPFGNKTTYSYANQARVTQSTAQATDFRVFRSVTEYVAHKRIRVPHRQLQTCIFQTCFCAPDADAIALTLRARGGATSGTSRASNNTLKLMQNMACSSR